MQARTVKIASVLMGLLLFAAMAQVLWMRYQAGDVYPMYSTLRPDPVGSKALYDTLDSLEGLSVRRWIDALDKFPEPEDTTLWIVGSEIISSQWVGRKDWKELSEWLKKGGRVVITLRPVRTLGQWDLFPELLKKGSEAKRLKEKSERKNSLKKKKKRESKIEEQAKTPPDKWWRVDPEKIRRKGWHNAWWEWGLEFDFEESQRDAAGYLTTVKAWLEDEFLPLDRFVQVYTGLRLVAINSEWKAIYTRQGKALAARRMFGQGEVIVWLDGYWLSNEAIQNQRPARLVSWLQGSKPKAVFDERHHGISSRPGVANLIRRLNLESAAWVLVIVALLFLWRASHPLVPPPSTPDDGEPVVLSREDAVAGLARLIRRSMIPSQLLKHLLDEWKNRIGLQNRLFSSKSDQVETLVEQALKNSNEKNLNDIYDQAADIINTRRK